LKRRAQAYFRDWPVTCWDDRYEAHAHSAPGLVLPTIDNPTLTKSLIEYLLQEEQNNSSLVSKIVETRGERGVEINPFALRDDISNISHAERVALLKEHFPSAVVF